MSKRINCPTCNSMTFTYTGETEKNCKLCGTKWDDYGNVVHSQPMSRNDAYEAIIAEESQFESQTTSNMENQQTQPQAATSPTLSLIQQLKFKLEDVVKEQENIINKQLERIAELEQPQQQQNTLTEDAAKKLLDYLHERIIDEIEDRMGGEYVEISIGGYSESIGMDDICGLPYISTPQLKEIGDAFIDAGIKVLSENNND